MRLISGLIGAIAALALLIVVVFLLLPAERLAQIAIDRLAAETGREITIEAATRPVLWPDLMISVEGLEVANPAWAGTRPLLRSDEAVLQVGWRALFGGDGVVDRLDLSGADLTLVRADDGRLSWRNGESSLLPLVLRQAELRGGRIRYLDRMAGTTLDVRQVTAMIDLNEGAGGSAAFATSGVANGTLMELSGTIAQAARFFEGTSQPVRLDLVWNDGSLRFNGAAALGGAAEGDLALRARDIGPVAALWGRDVPESIAERIGNEMAVRGTVSVVTGGSFHLRGGVVELGETRLNAALDLVPGEDRPLVRGTITGGEIGLGPAFDFAALTQDGTWSRDPIDVSGLFDLDADLTVRADGLGVGPLSLEGLDMRVALTRGRMVFDIAQIGLAEGQLAGEFVINGRGGLSVGGDLLLANAQAGPLLEALAGDAPLEGRGSASIEFLGVGDDLHSIIAGLEAEGDLSIGQGTLTGVDLPGLARNLDELADATEFDRLLAEFRVRGGVVISEDLMLDGPWGGFIGAGQINLTERAMDYRLVPENWPERELAVPVLINGDWGELEAVADAEALAALAAAAAADRARAAEVARLLGGPIGGTDPDTAPEEETEE
ncbi:AsmA family protein [Gymnodinialimonas hymeniacidonis]|uniref:AsmA family protein n=1 Tax=Gymnodinialimonas hymeniacidonis TaxID=3126508 RepID=UPI0034C65600